ncbi:MAG: BON domain-containing protein [Acidobacteriota bacterium]
MHLHTDSETEQWVLKELSEHQKIRSREICVLARDGVVKLQGSAQSDEDKLAIEETICRIAGVVGVVNEMRVRPVVALINQIPMSVPLTDEFGVITDRFAGSEVIYESADCLRWF